MKKKIGPGKKHHISFYPVLSFVQPVLCFQHIGNISSLYLTLSLPLATKVDRTPSVPLATGIALFTNVRVWSLISLT